MGKDWSTIPESERSRAMLRYKKRNIREGFRGMIPRRHPFLRESVRIWPDEALTQAVREAYQDALDRYFRGNEFDIDADRWLTDHEGAQEVTPQLIRSFEQVLKKVIDADCVRHHLVFDPQDLESGEQKYVEKEIRAGVKNPRNLLGKEMFEEYLRIILDIPY